MVWMIVTVTCDPRPLMKLVPGEVSRRYDGPRYSTGGVPLMLMLPPLICCGVAGASWTRTGAPGSPATWRSAGPRAAARAGSMARKAGCRHTGTGELLSQAGV